MLGSSRPQPKPNGLLPSPESYATCKCGPKAERPLAVGIGMLAEAVPEVARTENDSPMPLIAPPPLGRLIVGRFCDAEGAEFAEIRRARWLRLMLSLWSVETKRVGRIWAPVVLVSSLPWCRLVGEGDD